MKKLTNCRHLLQGRWRERTCSTAKDPKFHLAVKINVPAFLALHVWDDCERSEASSGFVSLASQHWNNTFLAINFYKVKLYFMKTNAVSDTLSHVFVFSGWSEEKHEHTETYLQNTFQSQIKWASNEFSPDLQHNFSWDVLKILNYSASSQ